MKEENSKERVMVMPGSKNTLCFSNILNNIIFSHIQNGFNNEKVELFYIDYSVHN
jgi:hypothetical protein